MRGQPYPAVGAELPVRFNLAAAIAAFLEELVKCLLALEYGGLQAALLGRLLFLVIHGAPSVSHGLLRTAAYALAASRKGIHLCLERKRVPQRASRSTHRQPPHLDDEDEQGSNMPYLIKCTPKNTLCTKRENESSSTFNHSQ